MYRYAAGALGLLLLSSCATDTDNRPEDASYIVEAILKPYCGRAPCHSTMTRSSGYQFDTVPAGLAALRRLVRPGDSGRSELLRVMGNGGGGGREEEGIMPPDVPLPDADMELITRWIDNGAAGL